MAAAVFARLMSLPLDDVAAFDRHYRDALAAARRWELCAATFLVWGHVSDDGFSDFRGGLVALGSTDFAAIVAAPDSLAGHPLVRAIAVGEADRYVLDGEALHYVAARAYEAMTGDPEAFYELDRPPVATTDGVWSGRFGSPDDLSALPARLPRLTALFRPAEVRDR